MSIGIGQLELETFRHFGLKKCGAIFVVIRVVMVSDILTGGVSWLCIFSDDCRGCLGELLPDIEGYKLIHSFDPMSRNERSWRAFLPGITKI
jgi:hypothetical protein